LSCLKKNSAKNGGALAFENSPINSNLNVNYGNFEGNTASQNGGAIYISNCYNFLQWFGYFEGNEAQGNGGGIAAINTPSASFYNSTHVSDSCGLYGGGIFGANISTQLTTTFLNNCSAGSDGSAIYFGSTVNFVGNGPFFINGSSENNMFVARNAYCPAAINCSDCQICVVENLKAICYAVGNYKFPCNSKGNCSYISNGQTNCKCEPRWSGPNCQNYEVMTLKMIILYIVVPIIAAIILCISVCIGCKIHNKYKKEGYDPIDEKTPTSLQNGHHSKY